MKFPKLPATAGWLVLGSMGVAHANTIPFQVKYATSYAPTLNVGVRQGNGPASLQDDTGGTGQTSSTNDALSVTLPTENLTPGAGYTTPVNFFTINPAGSCGTGCVNNTASGTITVKFSFTSPAGATGNLVETGLYTAKYSGPYLSCSGKTGSGQSDCIQWSSANDPLVVHFSNGSTLDIKLINAEDWSIRPQISFMDPVPGPAVGAGLPGLVFAGAGLLTWWWRSRATLLS